ncbi:hypothetical protein JB92DRAFT_3114319 [Gautieria morchelliformis]|nr:hypothetical protein JB92DRAFT_3114319 [Gautieria morchelliformis]
MIQANKELAGKLLEDDGYIFGDITTSMGIYEHPILEDVINAQWFSKKKSDSIVFGSVFNPILGPVIALVFTAFQAGFHNVPERVKTHFDNAKLTQVAAAIHNASDEE